MQSFPKLLIFTINWVSFEHICRCLTYSICESILKVRQRHWPEDHVVFIHFPNVGLLISENAEQKLALFVGLCRLRDDDVVPRRQGEEGRRFTSHGVSSDVDWLLVGAEGARQPGYVGRNFVDGKAYCLQRVPWRAARHGRAVVTPMEALCPAARDGTFAFLAKVQTRIGLVLLSDGHDHMTLAHTTSRNLNVELRVHGSGLLVFRSTSSIEPEETRRVSKKKYVRGRQSAHIFGPYHNYATAHVPKFCKNVWHFLQCTCGKRSSLARSFWNTLGRNVLEDSAQ